MTVPVSVLLYLGVLCLLGLERAAELVLSRRNARRAFAAGGVETGRCAFAVMVVVHALFPMACSGEVLLLAVVLEIASIPLIHGAWLTALAFSALNVALLAVRVPAEERALGRLYTEAFKGRSRLLPRGPHA